MFETNGQMFLEVMEGRWIELHHIFHLVAFIFGARRRRFFLYLLHLDRDRGGKDLFLSEELINIDAGIALFEVGDAGETVLVLLEVLNVGRVFFLKEDEMLVRGVHF